MRPTSALYVPEKKPWQACQGRKQHAKEGYLGLEFKIARQSMSPVLDRAGITELDDHLAEEDAARVHVWHRDDVLWR